MTTSWLGNIPFSDEEESDKLNRQIDLLTTKAPKTVGESHPKHKDFYWSGAKWLNVNDLPKIPSSTSEDNAVKTIKKAKKDSAVNLETDRSIAATNARSSLITAAEGQASGKGSVGKGLLTLQRMQTPATTQTESQVNSGVTPAQMQSKLDQQYMQGWNDPKTAQMRIENPTTIPKHLLNIPIPGSAPGAIKNFDTLNPAQMKEFKKLSSGKGGLFSDAKSTANSLSGIANIAGMIAKLQQKDATPSISPGENAGDDDLYGQFYVPNMYA